MSFHIRFRTFKHFWFYFILFYSIFRPYQTSGFYPTFLYQYGFPRHSFCLCSFLNVTSSYPVFPPKSFFFLFIDIAIFFSAAWFAIWNFDSVQLKNLVFWFPFVWFLPYHSFVFGQLGSPTGYCADWTGLSLKRRYRNTRHKRDDFYLLHHLFRLLSLKGHPYMYICRWTCCIHLSFFIYCFFS